MSNSYVYILTNKRNGILYVGATTNLVKRIWEHKNNMVTGFTANYNVHLLVYYEIHGNIMEAARREKRFKNWCRAWKLNLIEKFNPHWHDLFSDICS